MNSVFTPRHFSVCLVVSLFFFFSCGKKKPGYEVQSAFYHWQTKLELDQVERGMMDSLGAEKLYVKFFDLDWDKTKQKVVPLAEVQFDTSSVNGIDIVPTIFITNRTFLKMPEEEVEPLAGKVMEKIASLYQVICPGKSIPEIQMDCDWTESTRKNYFQFLASLRSPGPSIKLSSTVRLHQFKYPDRTGVPPVDRGMLMAYNIGEVDEWETDNSILELGLLDSYLSNVKTYPIPLDLALPIFRWGVVFRADVAGERKLELAYLINDLGPESLADTSRFLQLSDRCFEVQENTYLEGYYLYKNDRVRLEGVSPEMLEKAGKRLSQSLHQAKRDESFTLSFYHLDSSTLKVFNHDELESVLEFF